MPRPMPLAPPVTRTLRPWSWVPSIVFVKSIFDVTWNEGGSCDDAAMVMYMYVRCSVLYQSLNTVDSAMVILESHTTSKFLKCMN